VSATDFNLAVELEALLQLVCKERGIAPREHDGLRALLQSAPEQWPTCCRAHCHPCVDDQVLVVREILTRFAKIEDAGPRQ
jgi:hypothetical protein